MPVYIVKLTDKKDSKDYYLEWSTVVDAPVTRGMSLDEFKRYYQCRYGEEGFDKLPDRLSRVEQKGTSSIEDRSVESLITLNRAGEAENHLDYDDLIEEYCHPIPERSVTNG